jgi:hypothetical protein
MPGPGAPLALLAGFAAALAVAGATGAGDRVAPATPQVSAAGSGLGPNVAVEVRAARPARALPGALRTLASETESPELARAIRTGLAAPEGTGVELERLLSRFSYLILRIEASCPPPAVLACRPAVRIIASLRHPATPRLQRELRAVLLAGPGETVARWRIHGRVLEVATGGLALRGERPARTPPLRIETNPEAIRVLFRD